MLGCNVPAVPRSPRADDAGPAYPSAHARLRPAPPRGRVLPQQRTAATFHGGDSDPRAAANRPYAFYGAESPAEASGPRSGQPILPGPAGSKGGCYQPVAAA